MDFALVILALLSVGVLRGGKAIASEKQEGDGPCEKEEDCLGRGLSCYRKICQCDQGWAWYDSFCHLLRPPCSAESPCNASKGLQCSATAKRCLCTDGNHRYSPKTGSCGLKDREPCVENGVLRHDLCGSGLCVGEDTNQHHFAGRCSCAPVDGINEVFPPGTLPAKKDHFDHPCIPHVAAHCDTFDSSPSTRLARQVNDNWVCACPEGRSYFGRLCVVADRSYGEDCARYDTFEGAGPTCNLDPAKALVCVSVTGGIHSKCRCQKKALTSVDGKVEYGSMTWNEATERCELAPKNSGVGVVRRSIAIILTASLYLIN